MIAVGSDVSDSGYATLHILTVVVPFDALVVASDPPRMDGGAVRRGGVFYRVYVLDAVSHARVGSVGRGDPDRSGKMGASGVA